MAGPDEKGEDLDPLATKLSIYVEQPSSSFLPQAAETAS